MSFLISIIIPVYNEKNSVEEVLLRCLDVMRSVGKPFEIIFVNDGSNDGTDEVLDDLFAKYEEVQVIHLRKNFGKASALSSAFSVVNGDIVITLDGDLQDQPEEIPKFLEKLSKGYDLVSGWKYPRRDPITKKLASKIYNVVTRYLTGVRLHDMNCGFKAYKKEVLEYLNLYGELHRYIPVIAYSYGFKISEIKIKHLPRKYGRSKYGYWRFFSGFFDLFTVLMITRFGARPLHIFGLVGFLASLVGAGLTLYLIIIRLMGSFLSNRPLFYFSLSMLIVGIQVIFFGLLGEMIANSKGEKNFYSIKEHKKHSSEHDEDVKC